MVAESEFHRFYQLMRLARKRVFLPYRNKWEQKLESHQRSPAYETGLNTNSPCYKLVAIARLHLGIFASNGDVLDFRRFSGNGQRGG